MLRLWCRARRAAAAASLCALGGLAAVPATAHAADTTKVVASDTVGALLAPLLGRSGKLRAVPATPERLRDLPVFGTLLTDSLATPGIHDLGVLTAEGEPVRLLALIPFGAKQGARLQGYHVGFWPSERGRPTTNTPPEGFIEVTAENKETPLSLRFRLADFLTHDQQTVWPKLLVIQPTLIDKLELIADELEKMGKPSTLKVMSGFRTPQYNARGVCKRCGRAKDSRHMYGDAADIFVDGNGDGRMDDLDGDGKVNVKDARWLARVAERVELDHPELTGGIGIYKATRAHGPFVHVDTRGHMARW